MHPPQHLAEHNSRTTEASGGAYGLQFTTISEAATTALMGISRKVALHASYVASVEPRDPTGAPRGLHGPGLIN